MSSSRRKGPLFIVAASICWSLGGLGIKLIPWGASSIIGVRSLFAALVFSVYRKSVKVKFTKGNILAAFFLSLTTVLFVFANKLTTAAAAILLQFSSPIFVILIHLIFYKIKPKISQIVAVIATLSGMVLFFADSLEAGGMLGNLLAIGAGVSFASMLVCNQRQDAEPDQSMQIGFLLNSVIWLPFAFFGATADPVAWGTVIFLGIFQVGIAYVLFSIGIASTPALLACLITALEPVLNPIWVAIFAGEIPGVYAKIGGVVIITTVVSYNVWVEKQKQNIGSDSPDHRFDKLQASDQEDLSEDTRGC